MPQQCGQMSRPMGAAETALLSKVQAGIANDQFGIDALVAEASGNVTLDRPGFCPPLYAAALLGWRSAVDWLLSQGADANAVNKFGIPTLHAAATRNNCQICGILLDRGARVNAINSLRQARFESFEGTALEYIESKGDPRIAKKYGESGDLSRICKLLLSRGATLDMRDQQESADYRQYRISSDDDDDDPRVAALFADVRAAGGWQPYVDAPRKELFKFRKALPSLQRGPSSVPGHVERLFTDLGVPDEVFRHVLAFWRSARDY